MSDFDVSGAIDRLTDIMRRYRIVLPPSLSLLLKTLVMLEGTARQLNPSFSLSELLDRHQARSVQTFADPQRWLRKMERAYRDWDRLVKILPGSLADVLSGLRGETFELKLSHHRLEESVHRSVIGILSAALFLGTSQLLSRASQDAVGYGANGIGLVFLVVASILALRLGRAIHKAEKQKDA